MNTRPGIARRVLQNVLRPAAITVQIDGKPVLAHEGETIATVLLAAGLNRLGSMPATCSRAVFCNMGTCFGCLVTVRDSNAAGSSIGSPNWQRACLTPVAAGMSIDTLASAVRDAKGVR